MRSLGVPYTIIAPAYFMDNAFAPFALPGLKQGSLDMSLPANRALQQAALQDVASFAVLVLERREQFLGKRVDIASDELIGAQAAEILSRVSGHEIVFFEVPLAQTRAMSEDYALMMEWFDRVGYSADIAVLRRDYPEVGWHTFEE